MFEFGWKEDAYAAFEAGYKAKVEGSKDVRGTIETGMPLLVHVRDGGGLGWEKDWRMGQLGWWHNGIDQLADWGLAHKAVMAGKGKILRLTHLEAQGYDRATEILDALEMFVKISLLVHRIAVLPEIPCPMTLSGHEWPESCPHDQPNRSPRWFVVYANESQQDPTFHCTMNDRSCRHTCLKNGWLAAHLEPYYAAGDTFRSLFPGPPREMDAPAFAGGEATSASLQEHFAAVADTADVAISVAHLPHDVTQLSDSDLKALWGCATKPAAESWIDCIANGQSSPRCSDLEKPQSRLRKEINETVLLDKVTWQAYDRFDKYDS
ncbi:hypothetical protein CYMTET_20416 [Cymbomonas tetramitiformis]|uniref:Uncharacterized protein n=1 Tax=Cymbomonas tetramitiformis TaxID=36881 RepID=A0AAE0G4L2_9CHLO|nr:hypothetical protein CYMTET_20416 [Cymbomonas tetramitiformis]